MSSNVDSGESDPNHSQVPPGDYATDLNRTGDSNLPPALCLQKMKQNDPPGYPCVALSPEDHRVILAEAKAAIRTY